MVPGLAVVFANRAPALRVFRWEEPLELGRGDFAEEDAHEAMISRSHVRITLDEAGFRVCDLGSRNGTFVAGQRISGEARLPFGATLRVGGVVLVGVRDILPFMDQGLGVRDGVVSGPSLRQALDTITLTRRTSAAPTLLLHGESGSGKELAAQAFHRAGPKPDAPFVAVNCATIPKELAECLLFGSRRGAYSGATDATGHVQAASGGTLFLDEVAELPPEVQSKLLRMLETREVLRLGETRPERVDVSICAASWRDLRAEVAAGRFRADLYFRIGQPEVRLPALRERVEEIPWHVQAALSTVCEPGRVRPSAGFIEVCAQRHWPGNVRELRAEVRRAAASVMVAGSSALRAEDLSPTAGQPIVSSEATPAAQFAAAQFPADEFAAALQAEGGNVLGAARRLGVDRNRVRRWLERYSIDAQVFKS
ncbi:MAG TPA: sigma 54-interacting transcriptional regulator [Polyangiaceae bacterium]|nr:sigma 54-interacting transcriptional regulator [Polyangiaceae bacterium]